MSKNGQKEIRIQLMSVERRDIDTACLVENPFQGTERTRSIGLQALTDNIIFTRLIASLIVVKQPHSENYIVCDGHRRLAVARLLGIRRLTCDVMSGIDAGILFMKLNSGSRPMKGKTWLTVYAKALDKSLVLKHIPSTTAKQIKRLVDILGNDYVVKMGPKEQQGPGVIMYIDRLITMFSNRNLRIKEDVVARWVIEHSMQFVVLAVTSTEKLSKPRVMKFFQAVQDNRPYSMSKPTVKLRRVV